MVTGEWPDAMPPGRERRVRFIEQLSRTPETHARQPAIDVSTVLGIFGAELMGKAALLVQDDKQMEAGGNADCVDENRGCLKQGGPSNDDGEHPDVHRVSRVTIQPANDKMSWRVDRGRRASSERSEVPDTPQVDCPTDGEKRHRNREHRAGHESLLLGDAIRNIDRYGSRHEQREQDVLEKQHRIVNFLLFATVWNWPSVRHRHANRKGNCDAVAAIRSCRGRSRLVPSRRPPAPCPVESAVRPMSSTGHLLAPVSRSRSRVTRYGSGVSILRNGMHRESRRRSAR